MIGYTTTGDTTPRTAMRNDGTFFQPHPLAKKIGAPSGRTRPVWHVGVSQARADSGSQVHGAGLMLPFSSISKLPWVLPSTLVCLSQCFDRLCRFLC